MSLIDVKVPDIGEFQDVEVIEVICKVGETVVVEDPLISMESDKATMDVPSPIAGEICEIKVKAGDKVSEGSLILKLKSAENKDLESQKPSATRRSQDSGLAPQRSNLTTTVPYSGKADLTCDLLVLGSGPGGYTAAFRAADLGLNVVLVERYKQIGGVCLNVGCIPSKALLHAAKVIVETESMEEHGVSFGKPKINVDKLRAWKDGIVNQLTAGLKRLAKQRKVQIIVGSGEFTDPDHLCVTDAEAKKIIIHFKI